MTNGKSTTNYDAIVVIGKVDDTGSVMPGWDYPFSKAEEDWISKLKAAGCKKIVVFREPDKARLRKLLAGSKLRSTVFVGHGEIIGGSYSFKLNAKANLGSDDLHDWAFEDVVTPRLSAAAKQRLDDDPSAENAFRQTACYPTDLSVFHSCNSLRDPALTSAFAGRFEGNPWYSLINLPPLYGVTRQQLRVDADEFSSDPVNALQRSLAGALKRLATADSSLVPPGYGTALREALAELIAARAAGINVRARVVDNLRQRFAVDFGDFASQGEDVDDDEAANLAEGGEDDDIVEPCDMPTKESHGELGCRHRVSGGGPCWQHEDYLNLPEDDLDTE